MKTIKFRRRLDAPIPELPELSDMIGRNVEITVVENPTVESGADFDFWSGPSAEELARQQGIGPANSIAQLQSDVDSSSWFDGFEETVRQWRREPWREGDE